MRLIGHLEDETLAERISHLLRSEGIQNVVEADEGPRWALWVLAEDDLEAARRLLASVHANPESLAPRIPKGIGSVLNAEAKPPVSTPTRPRASTRPVLSSRDGQYGIAWVTLGCLALCIVIAVRTGLTSHSELVRILQIAEVPYRFGGNWERFLPEVRAGQVWRLFTPALLHFGWPHILFNLWAFWDLGNLIERRASSARLLGLILGLGVISNLGQYLVAGPRFGGMSGVLYGLMGYLWMMGRYRPEAGLGLHPQTVVMMLVWFFICLSDALGVPVANTAHGVGLVAGMLWGRWSAARMP